jgi:hypothetical protein
MLYKYRTVLWFIFKVMNSKKNKTSGIKIVVAALGTISIALSTVGCTSFVKEVADKGVEQALVTTSSEMNKKLPMMVDKVVRLDTVIPGPNKTLIYKYTLVGVAKAGVDVEKMKSTLKPTILQNYKTNPEMQKLRSAEVSLKFQYYDKDGAFITDVEVNPSDVK